MKGSREEGHFNCPKRSDYHIRACSTVCLHVAAGIREHAVGGIVSHMAAGLVFGAIHDPIGACDGGRDRRERICQ